LVIPSIPDGVTTLSPFTTPSDSVHPQKPGRRVVNLSPFTIQLELLHNTLSPSTTPLDSVLPKKPKRRYKKRSPITTPSDSVGLKKPGLRKAKLSNFPPLSPFTANISQESGLSDDPLSPFTRSSFGDINPSQEPG
jgi:hypothetical protein